MRPVRGQAQRDRAALDVRTDTADGPQRGRLAGLVGAQHHMQLRAFAQGHAAVGEGAVFDEVNRDAHAQWNSNDHFTMFDVSSCDCSQVARLRVEISILVRFRIELVRVAYPVKSYGTLVLTPDPKRFILANLFGLL